jgi:hypothetical protein
MDNVLPSGATFTCNRTLPLNPARRAIFWIARFRFLENFTLGLRLAVLLGTAVGVEGTFVPKTHKVKAKMAIGLSFTKCLERRSEQAPRMAVRRSFRVFSKVPTEHGLASTDSIDVQTVTTTLLTLRDCYSARC